MEKYADLILENADIVTCDPMMPRAEAAAIQNGRIIFVGARAEALRLMNPLTHVLDCQQKHFFRDSSILTAISSPRCESA
jgi:predicted amidohydrolase YtcJ